MNTHSNHETTHRIGASLLAPIRWARRFLKKGRFPLVHEAILEKEVAKVMADENTIGLLLFGSVASGTHNRKSDIDLLRIYKTHKPATGIKNRRAGGVKVGTVFFTYETLVHSQETFPYLLHIFVNAKLLFDRNQTIEPVLEKVRQYFLSHPEVEEDWDRIYARFRVEKNASKCEQTTILQVWDELEDRYSDWARKRTFFKTL